MRVQAGSFTLNNAKVPAFQATMVKMIKTTVNNSKVAFIIKLKNTGDVVDTIIFSKRYVQSQQTEVASVVVKEGQEKTANYYQGGPIPAGELLDVVWRSYNWNLGSYTINGTVDYR